MTFTILQPSLLASTFHFLVSAATKHFFAGCAGSFSTMAGVSQTICPYDLFGCKQDLMEAR